MPQESSTARRGSSWIYPKDDRFVVDRDLTATHQEVVAS
jgi:hypothetical protein